MERKGSKETGILESLVNQMFGKTIAQNSLEEGRSHVYQLEGKCLKRIMIIVYVGYD